MFSGNKRFGKYLIEKDGRTFPVLTPCNKVNQMWKAHPTKLLPPYVRLQEESNGSVISCVFKCAVIEDGARRL